MPGRARWYCIGKCSAGQARQTLLPRHCLVLSRAARLGTEKAMVGENLAPKAQGLNSPKCGSGQAPLCRETQKLETQQAFMAKRNPKRISLRFSQINPRPVPFNERTVAAAGSATRLNYMRYIRINVKRCNEGIENKNYYSPIPNAVGETYRSLFVGMG